MKRLKVISTFCTSGVSFFIASKCKILSVSKAKNSVIYNYMLKGVTLGRTLESIREYVDVGVTVYCDLNWNTHVKKKL